MMAELSASSLRFEGRVASVTGTGGQKPSLGETLARSLASRGAKVVVQQKVASRRCGSKLKKGNGQSAAFLAAIAVALPSSM
jgi:hypothetical protein